MSIFDNLGSSVSTLSDALGGFLSPKAPAQDAQANAEYKTLRQYSLLGNGIDKLNPNPRPGQYAVTPGKATVTVDPEQLQQEWLRRLDNYSTIAAKTGVKTK